ncbi:MAG: acetyl-CoA carboxylase biotin carboxyl carrier protein [Phycisphaerae bacterium]|nr:acetyl-CoA carboxylase biotin carboxyl carrier protein [Phycisphaerae bacterium]
MKDKDLAKVKELIEIMKENDLVEIEIAEGDSKIHLKRPQPQMQAAQQIPMAQPLAPAAAPVAPTEDSNLKFITSPMVGTFYGAPSPDSEPYVKVGDRVDEGTVVCIIEAMKVMNEIKAEMTGTVKEIMCQPGQAIEFDEVLFKVKPD